MSLTSRELQTATHSMGLVVTSQPLPPMYPADPKLDPDGLELAHFPGDGALGRYTVIGLAIYSLVALIGLVTLVVTLLR